MMTDHAEVHNHSTSLIRLDINWGPTPSPGRSYTVLHRDSISSLSQGWEVCVFRHGLRTWPPQCRTSLLLCDPDTLAHI